MLRALALTLVAALALAATAAARTVDVPARFGAKIPDAAAIDVPVLLPSRANLDIGASARVYADAVSHKGAYALSLSGAKDCTAGACFLALFLGERGVKLGHKSTNVALALGMKGYYSPVRCGASCAPGTIAWIQKGVHYEIQAKALGGRKAFMSMANSAIRNGNRG